MLGGRGRLLGGIGSNLSGGSGGGDLRRGLVGDGLRGESASDFGVLIVKLEAFEELFDFVIDGKHFFCFPISPDQFPVLEYVLDGAGRFLRESVAEEEKGEKTPKQIHYNILNQRITFQ